ncbi:15642_t:CDS:2 [Rhizophagus irregularis]|nr:15642_t:CDS:2 [Rhizophagus irregularis]
MIVENLYHEAREELKRIKLNTTTTSSALHFIAILMKSSSQVSAIPFNNVTNQLIQNPKGVDFRTKKSFTNLFGLPETYEERTERLLVHSYDIRIAERKNDRSMQNTKLIDLLEGSLHSTKDYISVIQLIANIPELHAYLEGNILVALWIILDRKMFVAVVHRMINGERSDVPPQILNIVPFIGPLHVSLNSWETVFLVDYCFFENMYHAIFNSRKILAKKPKPYLHLRVGLWSKNLSKIFFFNCKYSEACMFINLLDDVIPKAVRVSGKRLLDLFQNVWKNRGCTTKKKIKKNWQYNLPTLGKIVDGIQLVSPKSDKLCDWSKCTLSSEEASEVPILLYNGIKDNCKIFQNMLNMKFDDDKDNGEVLEDQASLEDNDDNFLQSSL